MKIIRLNLGKNWFYFDSQQFQPVGNKCNFTPGDILYHDSEFYIVVPRKKLKRISWVHAGKKIYEFSKITPNYTPRRMSKTKTLFSFRINKDEELQTCLKLQTFPPRRKTIPELPVGASNENAPYSPTPAPLSVAEKRTKSFFYEIVEKDSRMQIRGNYLYIESKNGMIYYIKLDTGKVFNYYGQSICIFVSYRENLSLYDEIIAKALTIIYGPKLISTIR